MDGPPSSANISTRQGKLAELARIEPKLELMTVAHHVDMAWLREAYRRTRKDGAAGVDGVTAAQYEAGLEANLSSLLDRFKSGRYRAPPVRRVHIPKPGGAGKTRPLGIPTLEDKVLQRAVLMALEPIFEQDFLDCSYGFRPGRGAHMALEALWRGLMSMGGGWVVDLDIRSFFDEVDRDHLRDFLGRRVRDRTIRRAVGKWLNAGVMEDGAVRRSERGTPQGGVISPLLSNLYLHHVLDEWFERDVKPRCAVGPSWSGSRTTRCWRSSGRTTRGVRTRCWGSGSRNTDCACIRTRPGWWTSAVRPGGRRAARSANGASRCWGSPTTGGARASGAGQ